MYKCIHYYQFICCCLVSPLASRGSVFKGKGMLQKKWNENGGHRTLQSTPTCLYKKSMYNMSAVVHHKTNSNDKVCTRDDINCQAPEMHKTTNIYLKNKKNSYVHKKLSILFLCFISYYKNKSLPGL